MYLTYEHEWLGLTVPPLLFCNKLCLNDNKVLSPFQKILLEDRKWKKQMIEWSTLWQEFFFSEIGGSKTCLWKLVPLFKPFQVLESLFSNCIPSRETCLGQNPRRCVRLLGVFRDTCPSISFTWIRVCSFGSCHVPFDIYQFNWTCIEVY